MIKVDLPKFSEKDLKRLRDIKPLIEKACLGAAKQVAAEAKRRAPIDTGLACGRLGSLRIRARVMQHEIDRRWAEYKKSLPEAPYGGEWVPHVVKERVAGGTKINITATLKLPGVDDGKA